MTDRAPDNDNELIDELTESPTPGQGDDLRSAEGDGSSIIRSQTGDESRQGDEPTLPNRQD